MMGVSDENKKMVLADLIWKHFFKFFVYRHRALKKIPKFPSFRYELEGLLEPENMSYIYHNIVNINLLYGNHL